MLFQRAIILAVSSFTLLLFSSPISTHAATAEPAVSTEKTVIDTSSESFDLVSQLPAASFQNDLIPGTAAYMQTVLARSGAYPTSIAGYKKLGYKDFVYSKWKVTRRF